MLCRNICLLLKKEFNSCWQYFVKQLNKCFWCMLFCRSGGQRSRTQRQRPVDGAGGGRRGAVPGPRLHRRHAALAAAALAPHLPRPPAGAAAGQTHEHLDARDSHHPLKSHLPRLVARSKQVPRRRKCRKVIYSAVCAEKERDSFSNALAIIVDV
jgi:hypothetical protein